MFRRLFITYLLLSAAAVLLVGIVLRVLSEEAWDETTRNISVSLALVLPVTAVPAYVLARRFTTPLAALTQGAERLADGDFRLAIRPAGGRETRTLAETFNAMSVKLAQSFSDLEKDKEQLETILFGMVEGVIAFNEEQTILFVNDRAGGLLEFPSEEAVGRKLADVVKLRVIVEAASKAQHGHGPYREEFDHLGADKKSLAVYVGRLPDSPGAIMVIHDITELRRLEKLRQEFVANVSHELKTPLANIKSSIEVLLDGAAAEEKSRTMFLQEIDLQAERLDALVMDLLRIARIESGAATLHFEVVPVEDAVHASLDRHRTRAEAKGLLLDGVALVGCPPDLGVWADEESLAQVLDNLVDNAIKYTPDGGRITVRWESSAQQVCFEVEDSGIGIPQPDLPRVFERFYRVDAARSRDKGGTGLGLSIVKHMVLAMSGTVRATSEMNRGTTFRICLPRAADR